MDSTTGNVDVRQGQDLEDDGGQPAETVGEDDEEETDGDFDFVGDQRRGVASASNAHEKTRVHGHDHQHAETIPINLIKFI